MSDISFVDVEEKFEFKGDRRVREKMYLTRWERICARRKVIEEDQKKLPNVRQFFSGQIVFMTGASGFLGRVIIEDLLRLCPEIGKIYIILREKKGVPPEERIKALTDVALFERLKREHPDALSKVVVLPGDCAEMGLGLSIEDRETLQNDVNVVINCAASVRFDDPVKKAVLLNLRGTRELVELCKGMRHLKALVHVSTAYTFTDQDPTLECVYPTPLDWRTVIRAAEHCDTQHLDNLGKLLLGFQPNTYTWTKAMAENVINDARNDLPVVIVRPSIVVASVKNPICGWVDNFNGFGGFGAGIMKGVVRIAYVDRNCPRDMIPVDVCADCVVLAAWVVGTGQKFSKFEGAPVLHAASGELNWETTGNLTEYCDYTKHVTPFANAIRYPKLWTTTCPFVYHVTFFFYHILFGLVIDTALRIAGRPPMLLKIYRRMASAVSALMYFNRAFHFSTNNVWRVSSLIHPDDQKALDLDVIDSHRNYKQLGIEQIYGICLYVLREKPDSEKEVKHTKRLYWAEVAWYCIIILAAVRYLYKTFCPYSSY